jgi:CRP/FNR family transcriptional regulator
LTRSDRQSITDILQVCPLFAGLKKGEIEEFARIADLRRLERGQLLFSQGDLAQAFFVLARGRMRVYKLAASGREQTLVTPMPGTSFAEAALFADKRYPAYCSALDDSEIVVIDKGKFLKFVESHPQVSLNMIALMAERLRMFAGKIEQLSLMGVVPRLAEYLLNHADDKCDIALDLPKSELASLLGTVPETLSRALAKLKANGLIKEVESKIHINDRQMLEEVAANPD